MVQMRGSPTGIPWPALGGEKNWVPPGGHGLAWLRPASAGKKTDSPKAGTRFFPRSASYFLSPGENGFIGVRGRGATHPDYRTAHLFFLGAHRGGGRIRILGFSVRPSVRSDFGVSISHYVSSENSTFWTILEPVSCTAVVKSDHLRNRTSVA